VTFTQNPGRQLAVVDKEDSRQQIAEPRILEVPMPSNNHFAAASPSLSESRGLSHTCGSRSSARIPASNVLSGVIGT